MFKILRRTDLDVNRGSAPIKVVLPLSNMSAEESTRGRRFRASRIANACFSGRNNFSTEGTGNLPTLTLAHR